MEALPYYYDLGYRFTQKYWGKGYATEAVSYTHLDVYKRQAHKPVTGSKGKVYSVCGLCLQRVLYRADMFY